MVTRVGINGLGRIGRTVFRLMEDDPDLEVVHVNDLASESTLAHLLQYDSVHGKFPYEVRAQKKIIKVGDRSVFATSVENPKDIPWEQQGCQIVLECTGHFRNREACEQHKRGTVKKVLLSAPGQDMDLMMVMGVNHHEYQLKNHHIVSNASCTTNCLAVLSMIVDEHLGLKNGFMTTIHSYTNDQRILDAPHQDLRRARTAGLNQIPTSTGAAKSIALVLPNLKGKLHGMAIRVPTANVSLVDLVVDVREKINIQELNHLLKSESKGRFKNILDYCEAPLVSSDYMGSSYSGVVDALSTHIMGDHLIKILAWYDNESGFSHRMVDVAKLITEGLEAS